MKSGMVHLVGAGPGDPSLLTLRAAELLRIGDVVAHDELVSPAILALAAPQAELLPVGRRHGRGATPHRIHPAVIERARAGRRVIRLKAGDPLIFGRGGEEAEALAEAGIAFEIVPGVSAALGAAAHAGIPLTDRRYSSSVTFATGHDATEELERSGERRPRGGSTTVLYMAGRRLGASLRRAIEEGHAPETPAAYIASATTPDQAVVVGTLATLARLVARRWEQGERGESEPALVIIGEVVRLRERIGWRERRPLEGRHILLGRARAGRSVLAIELRTLGAEVHEAPDLEATPVAPAALDALIDRAPEYDAIVFSCAQGIEAVIDRLPRGLRTIAVGRAAAVALRSRGIEPSLELGGACRDALAGAGLAGKRLLVVGPEDGRPGLARALGELGASVEPLAAYVLRRRLATTPERLHAVVVASSSSVRALVEVGLRHALAELPVYAIGERTAAAAAAEGARRIIRAADDTIPALLACIAGTGPLRGEEQEASS